MTYSTIATIHDDAYLRRRITACAAQQNIASPESWAVTHAWDLAAQPGWADSWESAVAGGQIPNPGDSDGVITDANILAAVQSIEGAESTA